MSDRYNQQSAPDKSQGHVIQINMNDAISYNSMIELKNVFDPKSSYHSKFTKETALIACALKSRKIVIIMLIPEKNENKENTPQG